MVILPSVLWSLIERQRPEPYLNLQPLGQLVAMRPSR